MERERRPAVTCVAACAVTVVLVVVPYLLALPATVGVYYRATPVGPPLAALFAILVALVVWAGYTRRTDPISAAGVGVALGLFVAGTAWWWAPSVDPATVAGVSPLDAFRHHRWAFALSATLVAIATGWYARSVLRSS